jgi:hypothetical protein
MENLEILSLQSAANRAGQHELESPTSNSFILANTVPGSLYDLNHSHIIPVYVKDNERLISHGEFIESTHDVIRDIFHGESIKPPVIRLSHPIKGRVPEAKDKPAAALLEHEKTLYFERMAFVIEIPSIRESVDGNVLSLTVGGVKSYSLDNLYNRKGSDEHFKIFIGFQNRVCTNLCVWTDGYQGDVRVKNCGQLKAVIQALVQNYNAAFQLDAMKNLTGYGLSEQQFATFIGRCRMYQHLPAEKKASIIPVQFGDSQIGTVVRDYYRDHSFCRDASGRINLWRLYNLFTGANKSSYIDSFLDRSVHAFNFVDQIRVGLEHPDSNWYLN